MKLVIDIPDDLYKGIVDDKYGVHEGRIFNIIRSGTPLPKGHGRLIDADELYLDIQTDEEMRLGEHLKWVKERFDDAPTIIEADTESEGKNE